jgi:hypothetical protein
MSRTMETSNVDARTNAPNARSVGSWPSGTVCAETGCNRLTGSFSALKTNGGTAGGLYCSVAAAVPWDYSELAAPGAVVNSITRV